MLGLHGGVDYQRGRGTEAVAERENSRVLDQVAIAVEVRQSDRGGGGQEKIQQRDPIRGVSCLWSSLSYGLCS